MNPLDWALDETRRLVLLLLSGRPVSSRVACCSWAIFAHVVDLLFFADMMISFDTAYWDDGNIITSRRAPRPQFLGYPSFFGRLIQLWPSGHGYFFVPGDMGSQSTRLLAVSRGCSKMSARGFPRPRLAPAARKSSSFRDSDGGHVCIFF